VRSFQFDDRITFGGAEYAGPWAITDFRVDAVTRRIALAAHHGTWWPSLITLLDERFQRRATFAHAGWLEFLHWVSPDRLVAAGFSQAQDGGAVLLLDTQAFDGQSPADPDSEFYCRECGAGRAVRYVVMPRSELNRVTGSRFNRARLEMNEQGLTVRTIEMQVSDDEAVDALYEFSPDLRLQRASFSSRYWEQHRALEMQGRIRHTRESCPDRDGPREVHVWEPQTGWTTVTLHAEPNSTR